MRRTIMLVNIVQDQQQRKVAGGVSHMPLSERYDKECGDVSLTAKSGDTYSAVDRSFFVWMKGGCDVGAN